MPERPRTVVDEVMETRESSLLDLLDHVLNKGVMATGDLTLGVAGVDLVYIRLSALLAAADRVLSPAPDAPARTRGRASARPRARRRASR